MCALLEELLRREGLEPEFQHDGLTGLQVALEGQHEAIILDVSLPGMNGFEILRQIRARKSTPILMLSARGDHVDRVVGLEMGADDYVPKPFHPRELVARIRALFRRLETPVSAGPGFERLEAGEVVADLATREAQRAGRPLALTPVEFDFLVAFLRSAGRLVTRETLSRDVLRRPLGADDRGSVDTHVSNLRRKLGQDSQGASLIRTVRSAGYLLSVSPSKDSG